MHEIIAQAKIIPKDIPTNNNKKKKKINRCTTKVKKNKKIKKNYPPEYLVPKLNMIVRVAREIL